MDNCIFCKIANHDIPGKVIYEDDICMAFLDLSQVTNGHTLVIPKKHYDHFIDVDQKTLSHMIKITQEVAKKIESKLNARGFNILTNMNEVAGQTVKHFHIHIIPRYDEFDEFNAQFKDRSKEVSLDEILNQINQ